MTCLVQLGREVGMGILIKVSEQKKPDHENLTRKKQFV